MATQEPFGRLVRRYRRLAELTQEALAERAGVSERLVRDIEAGSKHRPRQDTVRLLARALELTGEEEQTFQTAARRLGEHERLRLLCSLDRELVAYPADLPREPRPFIGREAEIAELLAVLRTPAVRLVTLTGPGGIGKTRLALQAAGRLRATSAASFVSLASLSDPDLVPAAVALALGIEEQPGRQLLDTLTAFLQSKQLLLVLDNFEHLLPAAEVVSHLLAACPQLQILVTSRAILQLAAEHEYPVPPLALPDLAHLPDLAALERYDGIALFLERARAAKPDFTLNQENAATAAEICSRLDGLPLAIELAAARLRLFPPRGLLRHLSQRLTLLTGGARDTPLRHQTLRAAIDWSYNLLDRPEQQLFSRLSVFAGGCRLEAIEAVYNPRGDLEIDVLDGVSSLLDQSLIRQTGEHEPRFDMLQTIREYAAEQLERAGDAATVRRQHAAYYLRWVQEAEEERDGPRRTAWLDRLESEHDNLRAALQWAGESGDADLGLRLALALTAFWAVRGSLDEGRRWLEELAAPPGSSLALRAAALSAAGELISVGSRYREAADLFEQSLVVYRELGDHQGRTEALGRLVVALWKTGEMERAIALLQESEVQGRETGDKALLAASLRLQAAVADSLRDSPRAQSLGEQSLALYRELDDPKRIADVLHILAGATYASGDRRRARALTDELLTLLRRLRLDEETAEWIETLAYQVRGQDYQFATHLMEELLARAERAGNRVAAARARGALGLLAREQGNYQQAAVLYGQNLTESRQVEDWATAAFALLGLSDIAREQRQAGQIIQLCEEALALFARIGHVFYAGFALHNLGLAAWYQGDDRRAQSLLEQSLAMFQGHGQAEYAVEVLVSTGLLALDQGRYDRAGEIFADCLLLAVGRSSEHWITGTILEGVAGVAAGQGHGERAARLYGAAEVVRRAFGTPRWPALTSLYDRGILAAKTALEPEAFVSAWQRGHVMCLEEAVAYALDDSA